MNKQTVIPLVFLLAGAVSWPATDARAAAFEELIGLSGAAAEQAPEPQAELRTDVPQEALQPLPRNNSEPGFNWPNKAAMGRAEDYFRTTGQYVVLRIDNSPPEGLPEGAGKCVLAENTKYLISGVPGFEGENIKITLKEPLPGCLFRQGYVYMEQVDSTSLGGASELPPAIRAFLDTLAYAEGTAGRYDYIFTFDTFTSYADHPRMKRCSGRLCSTAAGRYQFLSDTWDALAGDLGLRDFSPPNQDKAVMELIRRDGAYNAVAGSASHKNFKRAVHKLNNIWASLPGSRYGQPKQSMAALWKYYNIALDKYTYGALL